MTTRSGAGGLRLPRRELLGLGAALGLAGRFELRLPLEGLELDLPGFLAEAVPLAREFVEDTTRAGQDRYLFLLAAWAALLRDVPLPAQMKETTHALSPARTFLGAHEVDAPFSVLHWRMEPGARILPHPHIYGNVVTLCLAGEVRIENHEMVGERDFDTPEAFRVRRTNAQILGPSGVNLVNLEHGYVHGFVAGPEGAQGLDLTTRIRPKRSTPTLQVGAALDEARGLFEGSWRHA